MNTPIFQPFINNFPGDKTYRREPRQTPGALYALVRPESFPNAKTLIYNEKLGEELGFDTVPTALITANGYPENMQPYATAYAGHQFGNWAGQLGDGRAIVIGEVLDRSRQPIELQWKGAGLTPYSRRGDGRAVLRSSLREYLMSEAMQHLGVPTTRGLSLAETGEDVVRDILYNGNPAPEKGAVVIRTAPTFLRFGHFQLLAARQEYDLLKQLTNWTIRRYFPEIEDSNDAKKYIAFFNTVTQKTIDLMVEWLRVGFVHGVMNTDNMSVLGLTIDYGPFSMLDEYDRRFTPNTTDLPGRRYAFGKQSEIALWNLYQFANALLPLINDSKPLETILNAYRPRFYEAFRAMMSRKLGLDTFRKSDETLLLQWQTLMDELPVDYTLFFVRLAEINRDGGFDSEAHFAPALYRDLLENERSWLENFIEKYIERLQTNATSPTESLAAMRAANPQFVLRNYLLYQAIEEVEKGETALLEKLTDAMEHPYENRYPEFSAKRPDWTDNLAGCSMLSCSS